MVKKKNGAFRVTGIEELRGKLKRNATLQDVKNVVKMNTSEMQRAMVRAASFRGHYRGNKFISPTGNTKKSINLAILDKGFTGKVGPGTHYSPYLIYGTRYMESQDFFRPAFYFQKGQFIRDMKRLMR